MDYSIRRPSFPFQVYMRIPLQLICCDLFNNLIIVQCSHTHSLHEEVK